MSSIFKERQVFDENYKPRTLLVRDKEASILLSRYKSRMTDMGSFTDISLIYGSIGRVGIGKTTVAWHVGKRLEEIGKQQGVNFKHVYINAFGAPSLHQILSVIADQLNMRISVRGSSAMEVLKAIVDRLHFEDMYALVTIDEFQSLMLSNRITDDDLYLLMRVYEEIPTYDDINRIGFLLVASDHRVLSYMRERIPQIESQVGFRMHLPAYKSQELEVILRQRAEEGLSEAAWDDYVLELIADYFGEDRGGDGSARKAILTLRMAAELAEAEGLRRIEEAQVRKALSEHALSYVPIEDLKRLSSHELILLQALTLEVMEKGGWTTTGDLMERYQALCPTYGEEARGSTQFHQYMRSLATLGLIDVRPSGKGMRGRTSMIRLPPEMPADRVKEVVESILVERAEGEGGRGGAVR